MLGKIGKKAFTSHSAQLFTKQQDYLYSSLRYSSLLQASTLATFTVICSSKIEEHEELLQSKDVQTES